MTANTGNAMPPNQPLGFQWVLAALLPPAGFIGWLWGTGVFERASCALSGSVLALLTGG